MTCWDQSLTLWIMSFHHSSYIMIYIYIWNHYIGIPVVEQTALTTRCHQQYTYFMNIYGFKTTYMTTRYHEQHMHITILSDQTLINPWFPQPCRSAAAEGAGTLAEVAMPWCLQSQRLVTWKKGLADAWNARYRWSKKKLCCVWWETVYINAILDSTFVDKRKITGTL